MNKSIVLKDIQEMLDIALSVWFITIGTLGTSILLYLIYDKFIKRHNKDEWRS